MIVVYPDQSYDIVELKLWPIVIAQPPEVVCHLRLLIATLLTLKFDNQIYGDTLKKM